ncbi:hypothetical protein GA0061091_103303 [Gordonia sp. v-85]|nr:hypothetical protein GA0061091_103303 [Gordonia sp. v-85]
MRTECARYPAGRDVVHRGNNQRNPGPSLLDEARSQHEKHCAVVFSPVNFAAADAIVTDSTTHACVWCSSSDDIAELRGEPRCGRCRAAEQTIAAAREFVGFYGLRPLGASMTSDDDEEREHRVAARDAWAVLNRTRTQPPPRVRSGRRGVTRSASTTTNKDGSTTARKAKNVGAGSARPADVSRPDHEELMSRAQSLLAQLAEIEERLAVAQTDPGLSGKAKASDLTAKRDSVLRTLAALEKAKRALEPA